MKLTKCYIENFGKLHHFTLEFNNKITILCEDNGFGKTTLAAFIKAMLYGFPKSSKFLERNDRKKYLPWQGGTYGGFLDFLHNDIPYRVERTFGLSPKEDHFRLYRLDPLQISNDYSENIGYEILGVSSDSYDKTTYLPQIRWTSEFATKELKDTLSNIVSNSSDIGTYEQGIKTLKKQRNELQSYRGKEGLLYQQTAEISQTEQRFISLKEANQNLLATNEQLEHFENQLRQLQKEQAIVAEKINIETEIKSIRSKYLSGIPSDQELKKCSSLIFQSTSGNSNSFDRDHFNELSDFFIYGVPDENAMNEFENTRDVILETQTQLNDTEKKIEQYRKSLLRTSLLSAFVMVLACFSYFGYMQFNAEYFNFTISLTPSIVCLIFLVLSVFRILRIRIKQSSYKHTAEEQRNELYYLTQDLQSEMYEYDLQDSDPIEALNLLKQYRKSYLQMYQFIQSRTNPTSEIRMIFERYGLSHLPPTEEAIELIIDDKNRLKNLLLRKQVLDSQLMSDPNSISSKLSSISGNELIARSNAIQKQIEAIQAEIIRYHKEIAILHKECDALPDLKNKLDVLVRERTVTIKRVELIDKAISHLQSAYKSLTISFIAPLKKRFTYYLSLLSDIPSDHIMIDDEVSVYIERNGIQRSQAYLSVGEMDLIALCMRLAIVDMLYPNEKPILILDDPFVNLDSSNIASALDVLKAIGQSHQILYLTCHSSRT